ncbi:MAG: VOC family protein [Candidatus Hodarchaeales archaeon]|jgi:catechol 2,3-dioxygenase-like lactoylglutathione lyase family enzyme
MLQIRMNQINVTNLEEAINWYTEILGFELSKDHYYPPRAVDLVQKGDFRLILYQVEKPTNVDYPNEVQSIIIFETDDLKRTMAELTKKGVKFVYQEIIEFPAGIFNAFTDPFGNIHEIVQLK